MDLCVYKQTIIQNTDREEIHRVERFEGETVSPERCSAPEGLEWSKLTWDGDTEVLRVRDQQFPLELVQANAGRTCTQTNTVISDDLRSDLREPQFPT